MRHERDTGCVIPCRPVAIRRLCHTKEHSNVFVESCRAHGAHGNGSAFRTAACFAPPRREQSTPGAERTAHFFHEQEVRHSRSRIPVLPHPLIVNPQAPPSFAFATMRGSENSGASSRNTIDERSSLSPAIHQCPAGRPVTEPAGGVDVSRRPDVHVFRAPCRDAMPGESGRGIGIVVAAHHGQWTAVPSRRSWRHTLSAP